MRKILIVLILSLNLFSLNGFTMSWKDGNGNVVRELSKNIEHAEKISFLELLFGPCCKKKPDRKVFPRTVRKNRKSLENDRGKGKKKEGFTLWGWITGTIEYADLDEVRKEIGDHYLIEINSGEEAFLNYLENRYFRMESEEKERVEIFLESHFPEDEALFRIKTGG